MKSKDKNSHDPKNNQIRKEGYSEALKVLHRSLTEHGFLATPTKRQNYNRIWGRDSGVIGLAALLTEDTDLIRGVRRSLETLADHRGPHGEIPSNVDPETDRVSLGGTTGRVDADLWFVILNFEYWRRSGDDDFLEKMLEPLEQVRFLLGAWEFNNRGLLYIPPTGDWADEYLQSGYVLYDQLLYLQALRAFCGIHAFCHDTADHFLEEKSARLKHLIRANYWFADSDDTPNDVYHKVLYEKGRQAAPHCNGSFWMPFFSPAGYGYRFDALANALVTLLGVSDDSQSEKVDDYIASEVTHADTFLLPAFHPVIKPKDEEWDDLQMMFSHTFKNEPHEYHNGGRWPMVTGFYAASLARRGKRDLARKYADGIHRANRTEVENGKWSFPEFLHGKNLSAGGTHPMAWSAAGAIIAEHSLENEHPFSSFE